MQPVPEKMRVAVSEWLSAFAAAANDLWLRSRARLSFLLLDIARSHSVNEIRILSIHGSCFFYVLTTCL